MSDLLVLVVVIAFPAAAVLGLLGFLTLGVAAVADLNGNGLLRQPAPGSPSSELAAAGSPTSGPAARMSSVTPSA